MAIITPIPHGGEWFYCVFTSFLFRHRGRRLVLVLGSTIIKKHWPFSWLYYFVKMMHGLGTKYSIFVRSWSGRFLTPDVSQSQPSDSLHICVAPIMRSMTAKALSQVHVVQSQFPWMAPAVWFPGHEPRFQAWDPILGLCGVIAGRRSDPHVSDIRAPNTRSLKLFLRIDPTGSLPRKA